MQKNINSELLQLKKSGLSAGFKASLATLVALHLLILLSSGFFQKIFLDGGQIILAIQTTFLFIFISIISNELFKWQISNLLEQYAKEVLSANASFLKRTVFKGAHITSFVLLVEIAIMLRFVAPILEKTPDTFGYLGLVLFLSSPFFFVATYLAAKNGFNKWVSEIEQEK